MWIIPKQLHTSAFAPDTAALNLDLNESSQICAHSLFVRSKPSPARTWSQKWKRDSWSQHLFGRILKPSLGKAFEIAWTSSLEVIPVSHSQQQGSDSELTTQDTSGHLSQTEFGFSDPSSASLKMSKDTSPSDSERSLESWKALVIKRRGEYSVRRNASMQVDAQHLTSASGCSSWPSPIASEVRQGFQDRSRGMKGSQESLTTVVVTQEAWQTPTTNMDIVRSEDGIQKRKEFRASIGRKSIPDGNLGEQMQRLHGHPAPANPSTDGSRPELWLTPRANEPGLDRNFVNRMGDRGKHCHVSLTSQMKSWATPQASDHIEGRRTDLDSNQKCLGRDMKQWATPRAGATDNSRPNNKGGIPLGDQARRAEQWRTPTVAEEKNQNTSKQIYLQNQVGATPKQWGTPTARDHKSGRGNEEREYKELTPMVERTQSGKLNPRWVETLMGLPVGWTMPSCASPLIIAPTNCDSSASESCQPPQNEHSEFSGRNSQND